MDSEENDYFYGNAHNEKIQLGPHEKEKCCLGN